MILTKEPVGKNWAVIWDNSSQAEELLYWRLLELAFKHCDVFSEVGVGYRPTAFNETGFTHWVSYHLWATIQNVHEQEELRQHLFRSVPKGASINAMVFTQENEAELFKEEVEKRMSWLALGGGKYWI